MKIRFTHFIIFLLISTANINAQSFKIYEAEVNGIKYRIDPRIELFNLVAMQFGHSGMSLSNIPYKLEVLERFESYKGLSAPRILRETWEKGWGVDDPMFFLLHLTEDFRIKENLDPGIISRGGGMEQLEKLASALKHYAEQSGFYNFFNVEQKDFYEQILLQTRYNFRDFEAVTLLEEFYGEKDGEYKVLLNLISNYGNFGQVLEENGTSRFYAVIETNLVSGDVPVFKPTLSAQNLILHEFSHGHVNPEIDAYEESIAAFSHLYEPIEQAMKSQGYHHWHTVANEHVVRAAVLEMLSQKLPTPLIAKTLYAKEIGGRYIYLDKIREKLSVYLQNRNKYPTFKDFVPDLIQVFEDISPDYIDKKLKEVDRTTNYRRKGIPKPFEFRRDSSTVFIVGTQETDSLAQRDMHSFADKYRTMHGDDIQLVTDDEALKMDLRNRDLVLFGTVEGNLLLKKHISELPVSISKDSIITNRVINGEDLQLVTSWVSPYDPKRSFIVYTAQKTKNIRDFNYSMHKDQFHYWVAKDLITLNKGNYKNYWNKWMPDILE